MLVRAMVCSLACLFDWLAGWVSVWPVACLCAGSLICVRVYLLACLCMVVCGCV